MVRKLQRKGGLSSYCLAIPQNVAAVISFVLLIPKFCVLIIHNVKGVSPCRTTVKIFKELKFNTRSPCFLLLAVDSRVLESSPLTGVLCQMSSMPSQEDSILGKSAAGAEGESKLVHND